MLLISHDRALLEAVGSRTVVIEDGNLRQPRRRLGRVPLERRGREGASSARSGPSKRIPRQAGASKNRRAELARLEREVEEAEAAFKRLEDELADPSHWSDPQRSAKASARHERARAQLDELVARWEAAAERVEG